MAEGVAEGTAAPEEGKDKAAADDKTKAASGDKGKTAKPADDKAKAGSADKGKSANKETKKIKAEVLKIDPKHDLALLKLDSPLPALKLGDDELLEPGSEIALTGFPIGAILGLYPATHRGYISAITPDAIPALNSNQLTNTMMARLKNVSLIYQLDAIAYPGNSGSPLYDPRTGEVIGVINKVLVKDTKESALASPTGISYAVPIRFVTTLLRGATN